MNKIYEQTATQMYTKLKERGISYTFTPLRDGYQWRFPFCGGDAVIHGFSYDNDIGHVETMGFPWDGSSVSSHSVNEFVALLENLLNGELDNGSEN